jgi:hypothetical protein
MRRKIVLAGLVAGVAAAVLPVSNASAFVCIEPYRQVTGQCSPCNTVDHAWRTADARTGGVLPDLTTNCFA